MKIIDNKGRIFGLINIIDLTVLLIFVLLIVGGGYKLSKSKPNVVAEGQKVLVKLEISNVRKPTVDGIEEGAILYHYDRGQVFGKIVEKKVKNFKEAVTTSDGKIVMADVPGKYVIDLTVEADAVITDQVIIVGGEHTRIGTQFRLKNKNVAVFATVLGIETKAD
ncbi:DUF4330 domain-containing protein [Caloranaerobacter azorensis]|uniref:DUF4330 domain-containing protein n=2 Tax=Caloranaerobacter azorensis TaxID=116090 RepID=A0A1M5TJU5_9FIRM|nr:DUF4330 domain-containing protein [Caloranaerobacter azorensis]QIB26941.1 DUF4330 domain-containing protein [Caloranaerobacter azorensis]SHH51075.1 protein of unknown function [Caloranaerobacter azorensis DSM 13643]